MTDPELSFQQFEMDYENALAMLAERHGDDTAVDALIFAEEARPNSGADQYAPDWIQPFVAVVAELAQDNLVRLAASSGGLACGDPAGDSSGAGARGAARVRRRVLRGERRLARSLRPGGGKRSGSAIAAPNERAFGAHEGGQWESQTGLFTCAALSCCRGRGDES